VAASLGWAGDGERGARRLDMANSINAGRQVPSRNGRCGTGDAARDVRCWTLPCLLFACTSGRGAVGATHASLTFRCSWRRR